MDKRFVPKVPPQRGEDIDRLAYATLCRLFRYPQNAFQPNAYIKLFENGGLSGMGISYGIGELPAGEEGNYDALKKEIIISEKVFWGLKNDETMAKITLAHELGHAIMHGAFLKESMTGNRKMRLFKRSTLPFYLDPEWQADRFAYEFVMPRRILMRYARQGYNETKLATQLRVSKKAISERCESLNINLRHPKMR